MCVSAAKSIIFSFCFFFSVHNRMDMAYHHILSLLALLLLFTPSDQSSKTKDNNHVFPVVGAIVDTSSRVGREQIVAMEIAIEDFYRHSNQTLVLHINDSQSEPLRAVLAAKDLIETQQVQAILGPQTREEVSIVAQIGSQNQVPIFSLADTTQEFLTERWPYLLQASANSYAQMKAIAAIVQSWNWHQVTVVYEDTDSFASGVIPHLFGALREVDVKINQFVVLSPSSSFEFLSQELENLEKGQCRVFIVHLSLPLAVRLFERAKEMKMMEKDYVWITTNPIASLVHSLDDSIISSMPGIVGVKRYFPENENRFQVFKQRFRKKFSSQNSEEDKNLPGIYAVQAYDAMWTLALAMNQSNNRGQELLKNILQADFYGLSGKVQFNNQKVAPVERFNIINVFGTGYRELGFWSNGLGFSRTVDENATYNNSSMNDLGQVLWPGGPSYTPRGWDVPTSTNPLRIAVPSNSGYKEYVKVEYDSSNQTSFSGFTIEVFKATVKQMAPLSLPYEFIAFNASSYDNLVEQIHLKKFDAVVGDVEIVARRYQYAEFTNPYTETGLLLIAPTQSSNQAWSFIKPFKSSMWILIAVITVYNGFVVWLIERSHCQKLQGSMLHQIGIILWLAFNTLFSLHGGKLHSNLSRMSMVVWLFVALVIIQTYTANLASMLTVQRLEPTITNVEALRSSNAMVGYCTGSYLKRYLVEVLKFSEENLKNYGTAKSFAQAFENKEIAAAFIGIPYAKVFLAHYCRKYMQVGPTYKIGGFGFAFPHGSPLVPSVNKALLNVSESGTLLDLEKRFIATQQCSDDREEENPSLSPSSFRILFIITGGTSTVALVIYIFLKVNSMLKHRTIWSIISTIMKYWSNQKKRFIRRVSDTENPRSSSPYPPNEQPQV